MTYLSFNFANIITVTLIAVIGFALLAVIQSGVVKLQQSQSS